MEEEGAMLPPSRGVVHLNHPGVATPPETTNPTGGESGESDPSAAATAQYFLTRDRARPGKSGTKMPDLHGASEGYGTQPQPEKVPMQGEGRSSDPIPIPRP